MSSPTALVQKLWNYCNILRDDGLPYGDYVEQWTFGTVVPDPSGYAQRIRSLFASRCSPSGQPSASYLRAAPIRSSLDVSALLLFKMADDQSRPPFNQPSAVPKESVWLSLLARIVAEVERRLSVVEELESVVSANLQRATRLQSILQKAFTGEL